MSHKDNDQTSQEDTGDTVIISVHDAHLIADALLNCEPRHTIYGADWHTAAHGPLTALLYTASPVGNRGGIAWVDHAINNVDTDTTTPGWRHAAHICRINALSAAPADTALIGGLADQLRQPISSRQHQSITYTLREAITPWLAQPHFLRVPATLQVPT